MISTRPRAGLVIAGLVAYLVFLLATVPADWLAYSVNRASAQHVLVLNPQGSAWAGKGDLLLNSGSPQPVYLGTLHWRLSAWRLLTLTVGARLQLQNGDTSARATVHLKRHGLNLSKVHADFDASTLAPLFAPLSMIGIGGHILVQASTLTLEPKHVGGSARIEWNQATAASLGRKPFGSYRVEITSAGNDRLQLEVGSATGALRVQGRGTWNPFTTGVASFNGTVESTDSQRFPPQMLAFVGQDAGGGRRSVHYQRIWRIPWSATPETAMHTRAATPGRH